MFTVKFVFLIEWIVIFRTFALVFDVLETGGCMCCWYRFGGARNNVRPAAQLFHHQRQRSQCCVYSGSRTWSRV